MMASMVAEVSSNMPPLSVQEKGSRNKRKFRAEQPLNDPSKVLPSILNDGLSYEFSADKFEMNLNEEQLPSPCDVCGVHEDHLDSLKLDLGLSSSAMAGSAKVNTSFPREVEEASELQDADWGDLTEGQLEVLVLSNLDMIFKGAIKKIMACGYTEEFATEAILRSGLCYGSKDTVSNIVDNALVFLRNEQDVDPSSEHRFDDLQQLAKYVLAELVCVLREVRPFFSTGDAMWCLLICDMNLSHACSMDEDPLSSLIIDGSSNGDTSSTVQPQSKVESESDDRSVPDPSKENPTFQCTHVNGGFTERINLITGEREGFALVRSCNPKVRPFCAVGISQMEEKNVSSRKAHSSSSKIPRQKSHLEKGHRGNGTKGTFRAAKFSGFILDKRYKSTSDPSGLNLKSASLKITKAMAMGVQLAQEHGAFNFPTTSPLFKLDTLNYVSTSRKTDHTPAAPLVETIPVADTELSLSLESLPLKSNTCQVNTSCNVEAPSPGSVGLPYDSPSTQWLPRDEKDDMIMKLIPRARELHNQLQEWTEWANQKVMQAARRLSKDKAELKALRQEKEEVEQLKKEKQSFEDNTMKKLSEMENSLAKASGQVARANAAVRRLEVENAALRREMEIAKLQAAESAASCQELSKREKKIFTKFQSWEKQKCIFREELAAKRRHLSQLQQELEQAKDLRNQLEARWKQEEKAKEEVLAQANSIGKEREQLETSVKRKEEETVRMKAETNLEKYKQDIKKLETQISQLRLKIDSSKIDALKRGINGGILSDSETGLASKGSRDPFMENGSQFLSPEGVKRERECVMCLSEEMSVVFLPCAHQVVCKMCNELHEKQGMHDCPSCRSPIVRRVSVRYVQP